jgi:hypothetical protein
MAVDYQQQINARIEQETALRELMHEISWMTADEIREITQIVKDRKYA